MPAARRPPVSVVVPTCGRPERLRSTLACLARQAGAEHPEVIVVDDRAGAGADDDSAAGEVADVARELSAQLDLQVVPGPHRGRAAARNAGAHQATGRQLVFLDDDVLVGRHFLSAHRATASAGAFCHGRLRELPTAARLIGELDGASLADITAARDWIHEGAAGPRFRLVANALERAIEGMASGLVDDVAPWLGCVGANVSLPRPAFDQAGGFDEGFGRTWGCEDLELGFRLGALGLARVLVPDALGVHLTHARPGRWQEHAGNMRRFVDKHPVPSVLALPALLGAAGTPDAYVAAVRAMAAADQAGDARARHPDAAGARS